MELVDKFPTHISRHNLISFNPSQTFDFNWVSLD